MADLFSVTAPLMIRFPDGCRDDMAECFVHGPGQSLDRHAVSPSPAGLVFFRPLRDQPGSPDGICLVEGYLP